MKHLIKLFTAGLETTLACPCRCETCGSSAGRPRPSELTTDEWRSVIGDLAALGCQRVTLMGGEPLARDDWPDLAHRSVSEGMDTDLITSGIGVDVETAALASDIGLVSVTVSVDGTREVHDSQRKVPGCFDQALEAIRLFDMAGLRVGVTSQVNRETLPTLEALAPLLQGAGAMGWQVQLTLPVGRAQDRSDLVLDPGLMPEVHAVLRRLVERPGLRPFITDNIGYLTKDDPVLRTPPGAPIRVWLGCFAGLRTIGITSDGGVKGCLALPDSCIDGSVRKEPLARIWSDPDRFAYTRSYDPSCLSGACADCVYAKVCRGGCTATAMTVHGRQGVSTHCLRLHGVK
ncbi:MAG: radical SAM protein [Deltaproteobacteria bacterium]|nr:radical SAM protein [Deltaproteobacteria bacterium]